METEGSVQTGKAALKMDQFTLSIENLRQLVEFGRFPASMEPSEEEGTVLVDSDGWISGL